MKVVRMEFQQFESIKLSKQRRVYHPVLTLLAYVSFNDVGWGPFNGYWCMKLIVGLGLLEGYLL